MESVGYIYRYFCFSCKYFSTSPAVTFQNFRNLAIYCNSLPFKERGMIRKSLSFLGYEFENWGNGIRHLAGGKIFLFSVTSPSRLISNLQIRGLRMYGPVPPNPLHFHYVVFNAVQKNTFSLVQKFLCCKTTLEWLKLHIYKYLENMRCFKDISWKVSVFQYG